MTVKKIKAGVIGVGHLGRFHVQQLQQIETAELIGVYDADEARSQAIAEEFTVPVFGDMAELLEAVTAVSVVVPTPNHYDVAAQALESGCHVFIEKPITSTLEEADSLLRMAAEKDLVLQVGHIERLNPAITALSKYDLAPQFLEGHRLATFSPRGADVPVVLDLMIHDIDVVLSLVKSEITDVRANGVSVISGTADIATARLEFKNGTVANLTASRISQRQMRKLRLFQEHMYIGIDFLQQLTEVYRLVDGNQAPDESVLTVPLELNGEQQLIVYEKPEVSSYNALRRELSNFIGSVSGLEKPAVDGYSARAALDVAMQIQSSIAKSLS
ncbi:Gfo/Idh/MocA family oxidoreductase [Candidatus Neomarinimicrobiota bacterium]